MYNVKDWVKSWKVTGRRKDVSIDNKTHWLLDVKAIKQIEQKVYSQCVEYNRKRIEKLDELCFFDILDMLSPREKKVLRFRFLQGNTLESTSIEFGFTRERIRQIENKALDKLKRLK